MGNGKVPTDATAQACWSPGKYEGAKKGGKLPNCRSQNPSDSASGGDVKPVTADPSVAPPSNTNKTLRKAWRMKFAALNYP